MLKYYPGEQDLFTGRTLVFPFRLAQNPSCGNVNFLKVFSLPVLCEGVCGGWSGAGGAGS